MNPRCVLACLSLLALLAPSVVASDPFDAILPGEGLTRVAVAVFASGVQAYTPLAPGEVFEAAREGNVNIITVRDGITGDITRRGVSESAIAPIWMKAVVENAGAVPPAAEPLGSGGVGLLSHDSECSTEGQVYSGGHFCARSNWDALYPGATWHQMDLLKISEGKYHAYAYWADGCLNCFEQMGWVDVPTDVAANTDSYWSWCKAHTVPSGGTLKIWTRVWYEDINGNANSGVDTISATSSC